jgi:hypothetical protein
MGEEPGLDIKIGGGVKEITTELGLHGIKLLVIHERQES